MLSDVVGAHWSDRPVTNRQSVRPRSPLEPPQNGRACWGRWCGHHTCWACSGDGHSHCPALLNLASTRPKSPTRGTGRGVEELHTALRAEWGELEHQALWPRPLYRFGWPRCHGSQAHKARAPPCPGILSCPTWLLSAPLVPPEHRGAQRDPNAPAQLARGVRLRLFPQQRLLPGFSVSV